MRQRFILILLALFASSVSAKEFIVKLKGIHTMAFIHSNAQLQVVDAHEKGKLLKVEIPDDQVGPMGAQIFSHPNVEYMVENFELRAFSRPFDPLALRDQWGVEKVNAQRAWELAGNNGSRNIIVAVIDTGVDYTHQALAPNMVPGYDFNGNDNDPMDETGFQNPGHGTHCAGVVGATGLIDGGIIGLSPTVSLMPIRFLGANGGGDLMDGIKSIDYAIENGAHIISASWGAAVSRADAAPLLEAVKRADDAGVIFIAAAANDGRNNDTRDIFPANAGYPNTISVAASGSSDNKPSWSNYGRATVHLAAPGENIMSTLPRNSYGNLSGTSMATPLVSGLVALLKAQEPSLTGAQARALLQVTGQNVPIDTACNCRVDAGRAMEALLAKEPLIVPAAATVATDETLQFSMMNGVGPFTYSVANENIASIDENGVLTARSQGETRVTVTDSTGKSATSLAIYIGQPSSSPGNPGNPGNPPGGEECPLGDPALCDLICQFQPDLPWCN